MPFHTNVRACWLHDGNKLSTNYMVCATDPFPQTEICHFLYIYIYCFFVNSSGHLTGLISVRLNVYELFRAKQILSREMYNEVAIKKKYHRRMYRQNKKDKKHSIALQVILAVVQSWARITKNTCIWNAQCKIWMIVYLDSRYKKNIWLRRHCTVVFLLF